MNNKKMFNAIAKRYDLLNKLISMGLDRAWRAEAINELKVMESGSYLDVGCGTGDLSIELAKKNEHTSITGIDPSDEMLRIAKKKAENLLAGCKDRIKFINSSAEDMAFEAGAFDGAISGFCVRNIEDKEKALREIYRVLKNGSRFIVLELSYPTGAMAKLGYILFTSVFVPLAARIFSKKEAYAYLLRSIKEFPKAAEFLAIMSRSGFKNCESRQLSLGIVTIYKAEKR